MNRVNSYNDFCHDDGTIIFVMSISVSIIIIIVVVLSSKSVYLIIHTLSTNRVCLSVTVENHSLSRNSVFYRSVNYVDIAVHNVEVLLESN